MHLIDKGVVIGLVFDLQEKHEEWYCLVENLWA